MKKETDFEKFRNQNPYKVPDRFFGNITKKTLEKAINRERKFRIGKMVLLFSSAASVIIIMTIGYFLINGRQAPDNATAFQPVVEEKISKDVHIQFDEIFSDDSVEIQIGGEIEFKPEIAEQEDLIETLIAGLSDEDLKQLEALVSEELFINEILND